MVYILSWSWADSTHDLNNVTKLHNHETNGERLVAFLNISQGTVAIKECKNKVKGQHHDSAKVRGQHHNSAKVRRQHHNSAKGRGRHHNSAKGRLCTTTKPHDPVPTCWHSTSVRTHAYTRVHTHTHTTHTHTHTHTQTHTHTHTTAWQAHLVSRVLYCWLIWRQLLGCC